MINIIRKVVYLLVPVIIMVGSSLLLLNIKNNSAFACKSEVIYLYDSKENNIKSTLQFFLYLNGDNTGNFSIYGYKAGGGTEKSAIKIARRMYFTYGRPKNAYDIKITHFVKFNNDTAVMEDFPEFISSNHPVIYIEKVNTHDYIVYDEVSPVFVCTSTG